jgi:hypothetical protein
VSRLIVSVEEMVRRPDRLKEGKERPPQPRKGKEKERSPPSQRGPSDGPSPPSQLCLDASNGPSGVAMDMQRRVVPTLHL